MAAVSNPLQGCIKRCTETYRECDRGESNLDSHHERNETDEVLRPCWFAHSLKTDSRSVENNQTKETPAAVGEKFFLALLLKGLFVHVRIYDWLFSCLYIQYILYSKYKVKIYNIRTSIQKIKSRKIKIKKMSEMDINISCRNCISENWDEYLEFFVSIIVWAIAQVNVIEFIFVIFRNEKVIPRFIVGDRGYTSYSPR